MVTNILAAILIFSGIAVIFAFTKERHPVLTAARSAACGISAMMLVNITSAATGCYIAVNCFTVFVATFLSLPGVVGMLFLNLIYC